jgi:HPt (histidine-containing phosphotransfer) domain-containing protein
MKEPYNVTVLEQYFESDVRAMLSFSRDAWLPELHASFQQLASAIHAQDDRQVEFFAHRIRGCAAMGGAHDIVGSMIEVSNLAKCGRWLSARSRFRDANYALRDISTWVADEYNNLAS